MYKIRTEKSVRIFYA